MRIPYRQVRALSTSTTLVVYQAYTHRIADPALAAGRFVSPFKLGRMTWIKPSFLWMMYRSAWGTKAGQERVLAVEITREGFEWALAHSCLSHFERDAYVSERDWAEQKRTSPVRVQWDPERSLTLAPLDYRAIQVGLSGQAVHLYVEEWITEIRDVTNRAYEMRQLVSAGDLDSARSLLPKEQPYPLPDDLKQRVAAT